MPKNFYAGKVTEVTGDLLPVFTLYADNDDQARALLTNEAPHDALSIRVAAIDRMHESYFGRTEDDGRGVTSHSSISWSSDGPIDLPKLFGSS